MFSIESIKAALTTRLIGSRLEFLEEVDSTNRRAMTMAEQGAPPGTVIVADAQTQGRGRLGRLWISPPGMNLYISVLLERRFFADAVTWVPLVTSLAVRRAVHEITGLSTKLKWPNDVVADRNGSPRKLAGILAESSNQALVVGIGINVNMPLEAFPEELRSCATSLLLETTQPVDRVRLLVAVLAQTERLYEDLVQRRQEAVEAYQQACETIGKEVRVELMDQKPLEGHAESIGADGALCVRKADGQLIELRAGDVIQLR